MVTRTTALILLFPPVILTWFTSVVGTEDAPIEVSIFADELPQIPLFNQVLYFLLQVTTIFDFMPDVPMVDTVEVGVPLLPPPEHLWKGTIEVILFHDG